MSPLDLNFKIDSLKFFIIRYVIFKLKDLLLQRCPFLETQKGF